MGHDGSPVAIRLLFYRKKWSEPSEDFRTSLNAQGTTQSRKGLAKPQYPPVHDPAAVYYGTPGPMLYSTYEPLIPRLDIKPPRQQMPFPSRAEGEEPEQLTYDDSVKAGVMIQMALSSKSAAQNDSVDDLLAPATLAELGRSAGGLESLF